MGVNFQREMDRELYRGYRVMVSNGTGRRWVNPGVSRKTFRK